MARLPTFVLVHGAWHIPACFDRIRVPLESLGYICHIPNQPSIGELAHVKTSHDDVASVRAVIQGCVDREEYVIVVGHSAGGLRSNDATKGFEKDARLKARLKGGVVAIALICAFIPPVMGKGAFKRVPAGDSSWWIYNKENNTFRAGNAQHLFYNDLPPEEAEYWESQLQPMHMLVEHDFYEAWRYVPTYYLLCVNDQVMKLDKQEAMVEAAREEGGTIITERIDAGHSPFLSKPTEVVEWLRRVAEEKGGASV